MGTVDVRGSKNAATKMMVASLLTDEPCTVTNVPFSADTDITKELCETIGSAISVSDGHAFLLETKKIKTSLVPELSRRNRIPILALGPLLHRNGVAEVPVVGGCYLGHRPINFHVEALNKMGVKIERRENSYYAEAEHIHGADVVLVYPSVGATENILLTAVLAEGSTKITNAAMEPEVQNLIGMLASMGARISVDHNMRIIEIVGVSKLHGTTYRVMPDRNEIVSFAVAALATGGTVFIQAIDEEYIKTFLARVKEVGGTYTVENGGIRFIGGKKYHGTTIETAPHPGFMTDWQQPFCVLLTQAEGTSIIHETVYEDRFGYVKDINRMGATIRVNDDCLGVEPCRFLARTFHHSATITGPTKLHGEVIRMTDLRAGMAHVIAALAAEGKSRIFGLEHIDRGYENIDERLRMLGAHIQRITDKEERFEIQDQKVTSQL